MISQTLIGLLCLGITDSIRRKSEMSKKIIATEAELKRALKVAIDHGSTLQECVFTENSVHLIFDRSGTQTFYGTGTKSPQKSDPKTSNAKLKHWPRDLK